MSQISSIGSGSAAAYFIQLKNAGNGNSAFASAANFSVDGENSTQDTSASSDTNAPKKKSAVDYAAEFLSYMQKTPAQRMRDDILKKLDLTEADLASMPPDKRAAVEQQIADEIKKRVAGADGSPSDSNLQKFAFSGNQNLSDGVSSTLLGLQEISPTEADI